MKNVNTYINKYFTVEDLSAGLTVRSCLLTTKDGELRALIYRTHHATYHAKVHIFSIIRKKKHIECHNIPSGSAKILKTSITPHVF